MSRSAGVDDADGGGGAGLHPVGVAVGVAEVEGVGLEAGVDAVHRAVGERDARHLAAAAAAGLDAQATVGVGGSRRR